MATDVLHVTEIATWKEDHKTCPIPDGHRWDDDFKLGDVCYCSTWQIIQILDPCTIVVIDVAGNKDVFGRL